MATATVSLSSGTANCSYFQFNTGKENGGYTYTSQNNGTMYIGQKSTSGNHSGVNCGSFPLVLYNLPNRTSIATIKSISFSIYTTNSTDGYNDCTARIEYIGSGDAAYNDYPGLWRCGAAGERISLVESATRTLTTTDPTTLTNFTNLIKNATSGTKYFFRIVKESGMGAVLKSGVTFSVTYSDGSTNVYDGGWKESVPYIWKTTNPTTYYYPEAAMTSNSSQGCTLSASSVNSSYPIYNAFDKKSNTLYSGNSKTAPGWIQITMPRALYNIKVQLLNRASSNLGAPIDGIIYGSNDGGTTLTQIGSFTGRSVTAGYLNTIVCSNSTTAYKTVRLHVTSWQTSSDLVIGQMLVIGTDVASNGNWVKAKSLVWKTENPKTYTYPEAAMTANLSQNCFVCASTRSTSDYPAWRAFDKNTANNWASHTKTYDPQPWIQLTFPRPLYNISVRIDNDSGTAKGPVGGIIYGSNDNGVTLTQIGSFTGRSAAASASTTHQCSNSTVAYNTVRIQVTTLASGAQNVDIGEIYISGTDIGTNGGWAGEYELNFERYPKAAMTSHKSQDCIAAASSQYNTTDYNAWHAFNYSSSVVWCTVNGDSSPWIQINLPVPLYNIIIILFNRTNKTYHPGGFIDFVIQGSKNGEALQQIYSMTGRDGASSSSGTSHIIGNKTTSYDTLKFIPSNWHNKGSNSYCGMGEILIVGTKQP